MTVESKQLILRVRSPRDVSHHAVADFDNKVFAVVWKEDDASCPSIIRILESVGPCYPVRGVSDTAVVTDVTGADNMGLRHWETARVNSNWGRADGKGCCLSLECNGLE